MTMLPLFGGRWDRSDLHARVGDLAQIAGATRMVLADGPEAGVDAVEVRTGAGLRFLVLASRGLDIADAEFEGMPLAWRSQTGRVHPSLYDPRGAGWLRGFYGGLMVTCGYLTAGAPSVDEGREWGQHGRASYLPAEQVSIEQGWTDGTYRIAVRGVMREAAVFGEFLVVRRTISTALGSRTLRIDDEVTNAAAQPSPLMLLYHVNLGFPLMDEGAEVVSPARRVTPRDAAAAPGVAEYMKVHAPVRGYAEQVFYHEIEPGPDGTADVALVNRRLRGGLGLRVRYDARALPRFIQWKMLGEGTYVMGLEPANCLVEGRAAERARGTLQMLAAGETRRFWVELSVLTADEFGQRTGPSPRSGR